jgi:hypothetical protein
MAKRPNAKGRNNTPGGFAGIPRVVMKHPDYQNLSGGAVKLLLELASQYKGKNNGDLTAAHSIVGKRGCGAKDTVTLNTQKLIDAGMIIQTREGRFTNPGGKCALYALTWLPIDECPGKKLTVSPTATPPRKFSMEINKTPCPETRHGSSQKLGRESRRDGKGRYSSSQKLGRLRVII